MAIEPQTLFPGAPHELFSCVFPQLGLAEIGNCRQVCKDWEKATHPKQIWEQLAKQLGINLSTSEYRAHPESMVKISIIRNKIAFLMGIHTLNTTLSSKVILIPVMFNLKMFKLSRELKDEICAIKMRDSLKKINFIQPPNLHIEKFFNLHEEETRPPSPLEKLKEKICSFFASIFRAKK